MCGIVGYIGKTNDHAGIIEKMQERIAHRGPDGRSHYIDGDVVLGHVRLSIIDVEGGAQPMQNEDGTVTIVFNGEIYNYKVLREELIAKGHVFKTNSDTEVLVHGYEEYGAKLLNKLRGMFAFVIWDQKKQKLFGARDFFGIKPFYYAKMEDTFLFASEIKAFMAHPNFKKELNEERLPDYMTFACIPGYDTMFKNVYKLAPGHYFEYEKGKMTITKYYEVEFHPDNSKNFDTFVEEIAETVTESVEAHKIADVEVGCFLSSGVDSSYVACELAKIYDVKTYTVGFADHKYSEADDAKMLADEIGVVNYPKIISADDYFNSFADVQYQLDEPLGNPSANNLYHVCERASRDLKVVLSGEGADEMFGGYNVYKEPLSVHGYQKVVPKPVRKGIAAVAKKLPDFKGRNYLIRGSKSIEERYIGNSNVYKVGERDRYLKKHYDSKPPQWFTKPFYDKVPEYDDITKMQYMDIHGWMVQEILLKADKMSMAHSLELRVPFLDKEIFALSSTIPTKYRVSKENTKLTLRKAANKEMNSVSANRKKLAFPTPLPEWIKEEKFYNIIKKYFNSDWAKQFFNTELLNQLLEDHKAGKRFCVSKIWVVFSFLVWYEQYFVLNR
jgi:asparagine synthase (glutamine-hydrolysing)